jgi:hypothetical protein
VVVVLGFVVAVAVAGCSFVESSKSSSKIVSSPFTSSSNSSSPGDKYRADVRDYTAAYLKSGGNPAELKQSIASVADKHGVSDWEVDQSTYLGLGEGLHKAGLSEAELDAYKSTLAGGAEQENWMQDGYDSYESED